MWVISSTQHYVLVYHSAPEPDRLIIKAVRMIKGVMNTRCATILRSPVSGDYHQNIGLLSTRNRGSLGLSCTRRDEYILVNTNLSQRTAR